MFRGIKWSCYQVTSVNQIQRKLEWATAQNIAVPPPPDSECFFSPSRGYDTTDGHKINITPIRVSKRKYQVGALHFTSEEDVVIWKLLPYATW